jgi:hypothetical protein
MISAWRADPPQTKAEVTGVSGINRSTSRSTTDLGSVRTQEVVVPATTAGSTIAGRGSTR